MIGTLEDVSNSKAMVQRIAALNDRLEAMVNEQHETIMKQQKRMAQVAQETGVGIWEYARGDQE